MICNVLLNIMLMGPLQHGGLALATSLAAIFNCLLLIHFLRKRLGLLGGRKILASVVRLIIASCVMGIIVYYFNLTYFDPLESLGHKLVVLAGGIAIGVVSFGFISRLFKNEELEFLAALPRRNR